MLASCASRIFLGNALRYCCHYKPSISMVHLRHISRRPLPASDQDREVASTAQNYEPNDMDKSNQQQQQKTGSRQSVLIGSHYFNAIASELDTVVFDGDGVLWLGGNVVSGSPEFVHKLFNQGKQVVILTNNATVSRKMHAERLKQWGYDDRLTTANIVNSAAIAANLLEGFKAQGKQVYLIGTQGIRDELDQLGVQYFGHGADVIDQSDAVQKAANTDDTFVFDIVLEKNVGAVLVSYEKYFNYLKLLKATNYLRDRNCLFIATNEDETVPGPNPDLVIPDAGPLVAAIRCASGRQPIVVGKPHRPAFDFLYRKWRLNPARTLMIGDRTNTDVKFGRDHGMKTLMVLSGCHTVQDITIARDSGKDDQVPDFYCSSLGTLL